MFKWFRGEAAAMKSPILKGFWALCPPKYGSILLKFGPGVVSHNRKTLLHHFFQNLMFKQKRDILKVYSVDPFLVTIYPGKPVT